MSTADLTTKNHISYLMAKDLLNQSGGVIALSQRTTFVFAPNATGSQPANVFTSWTALLTAVALTRGPITIQLDSSPLATAITLPGGDLSGHNDIWLVGTPNPTGGVGPLVTITGNFTNGYVTRFSTMILTVNTSAGPAFKLPTVAAGGAPTIQFDTGIVVTCSPGEALIEIGGLGASSASLFLLNDSTFTAGNTVIDVIGGVASSVVMWLLDNAGVGADTLAFAAPNSIAPRVRSPGATYDNVQTNAPGGVLNADYTFVGAADTQFARADSADASPASPAVQVPPVAALTDVLSMVLTPRNSGKYYVSASLSFTETPPAVNEDTTISLVTRRVTVAGSTIVVVNGTVCGTGTSGTTNRCVRATASGPITYTVATNAPAVHTSATYTEVFGAAQNFNWSWSGYIDAAAGVGFTLGENFVVAVSLTSAATANITGPGGLALTGSIAAYELDS